MLIKDGVDLNARPYRAFVKIADLGSFHAAARALAISQPALSAQIQELERQLGFLLFQRHNRRVSLTAEGALFLDRARRLILETDWINQAARDIRENELRVGAAHFSAGIPERCTLLERFAQTHPKMPIKVLGKAHAQLFESLDVGEIDIAITLEPFDSASQELHIDDEYERKPLGTRPIGVALPATHAFADKNISGAMLRDFTIGTIDRSHGIGLSESVARRLAALDAAMAHPPERDASALLRYAKHLAMPVVDLGWFRPLPEGVAACRADIGLSTQLVIISRKNQRRAAADVFLQFAINALK